jgi:hypothetical protein
MATCPKELAQSYKKMRSGNFFPLPEPTHFDI